MADVPLLALRGITKRYGGTVALEGVDFDLRRGEIHALLGENGAGKSTLIKVLGGLVRPDSGTIMVDGQPAAIRGVADADRLGIRLIHQELTLAPNLTVAENILLGREPTRFGLLDRRRLRSEARAIVDALAMPEIGDLDEPLARLSVARRQMVEIARALAVRARVLVLDEPTAALSEAESDALFARLDQLRAQGVGLVYITHRLAEIRRLADRITVLRDGRRVGTQEAGAFDAPALIRGMVGRDLAVHEPRPPWNPGAIALDVRDLRARGVHGVSFALRCGEVLGLVGLVGAGRTELARALFGIEPIAAGSIHVAGRHVTIRGPADAIAAGVVLVPEDRQREGLILTRSVAENLALPWADEWVRAGRVDARRRRAIVERAIAGLAIKAGDPERPVGELSGGNQQKVALGRWLERPPRVLILDEPTRGVDVGARAELYAALRRLVAEGMAILLISSDLPEILALAHRLALYRDGRILRELPASSATAEEVMAELTRAASA